MNKHKKSMSVFTNAAPKPSIYDISQKAKEIAKSLATQGVGVPRECLPSPRYYYKEVFGELPSDQEWVSVACVFHEDRRPSLSLNLESGGYCCHSGKCGVKGGDLIDFHRRYHDAGFSEAVQELKQMKHEEESQ